MKEQKRNPRPGRGRPSGKKTGPGGSTKRPYARRDDRDERPGGAAKRPYARREDRDERPGGTAKRPYARRDDRGERPEEGEHRPYKPREGQNEVTAQRPNKPRVPKTASEESIFEEKSESQPGSAPEKVVKRKRKSAEPTSEREQKWAARILEESGDFPLRSPIPPHRPILMAGEEKFRRKPRKQPEPEANTDDRDVHSWASKRRGTIRLNKYIANAGICSRREADDLIATGVIAVNGKIVTEMGCKISPDDVVSYDGQVLMKEKPVYVLLNKPKGYITTMEDPEERNTVLALVADACKERIYPVGRLDRNTTGLLLFTNDGEMTKKLTHPKHGVKKIYHVELDKKVTLQDMRIIANGVELDDGFTQVDEIAYEGEGKDKAKVGVVIHSGKNRVVRRIFESLGYKVMKLDRVYFAGLTKKDLPRGKWRFLKPLEVNMLKMLPKA